MLLIRELSKDEHERQALSEGNWQRVIEHKLCGFHLWIEIGKISEFVQASRKLSIMLADSILRVHFREPRRGFLVFVSFAMWDV